MKYLGTVSDCLSPSIADCRTKARAVPSIISPLGPVTSGRSEVQSVHFSNQSAAAHSDHSSHLSRPNSGDGSILSSSSGSSHSAHIQLPGESSQSSARPRSRGRGRSSPPSNTSQGSAGSSIGAARSSSGASRSSSAKSKDNPLGLLTPDFFKVSKNGSNTSEDSASNRSWSPPAARLRVRSPHSIPPVEEIPTPPGVVQQDTLPALPRRPGSSFSARKSCSDSMKTEQPLRPSSGVTNLALGLLPGPVTAGPSHQIIGSTPEDRETSCVTTSSLRKPVSFNNRGKDAHLKQNGTYNGVTSVQQTERKQEEGTERGYNSQRNARHGSRSGTSTVPSGTVLVPTSVISTSIPSLSNYGSYGTAPTAPTSAPTALTSAPTAPTSAPTAAVTASNAINAAFSLASAAQSATNRTHNVSAAAFLAAQPAPPHPAFLQAFSTAESTTQLNPPQAFSAAEPSSQINPPQAFSAAEPTSQINPPQAFSAAEPTSQVNPPPGFGPVPMYRTIPSGFEVAPIPCRNTRLRAKLNESVSSEDAENCCDPENRVKPVKKRGRN